eukprot:TRINITY_DN20814_c0_g1_i1.p1 TRINITY_DN20814_c0_g1~~TRINITY_DN20814_c0_g1_i1.p1  ORF type:complete len:117 (-),score=11.38 TRINITY_DN20814_c0_g1_i1:425-775(-)
MCIRDRSTCVRELKAPLGEKSRPKAVKVLRNSVWVLMILLTANVVVNWVYHFYMINKNIEMAVLSDKVAMRIDAIGMISLHTRVKNFASWGLFLEGYFEKEGYHSNDEIVSILCDP